MSLFKTRDWWSVTPEDRVDDFNSGSLIVANITNDDTNNMKIIVGGFSGILRIYSPQTTAQEDGSKVNGFRADHLYLEVSMEQPILQLAAGKFVSGNENIHLCVLHIDHFVIYTLSVVKGQTDHGIQTKLTKVYKQNFQRKAYSITTGNFGLVKGKDFIAVQSLDGCISFYEQESLAFVCFLPGFLLPGPLAYLPKSDTIVTQASDWTLQSYKYQTLSMLVQDNRDTNTKSSGGKRIQPEWTQIMCETALEIKILVEKGNVSSILVLTTHAFMCFKDSGVLKFFKKLEYNPSCFTSFHNDNYIFVCIASHSSNLLVYRENELKWAAQLSFVPVAIERSDFQDIKGALVLLGEMGQIQVSYLGTDPSLFAAPPTETREINYEETDKEMAQLIRIIRNSTKDSGSFVNTNKGDKDIMVSASVGNQLEAWTGPTRVNDADGIPCVTLVIKLTTHLPINAVRVDIHVEKPIGVTQNTFVLGTVCDSCQILVKFFLAESYVPSSLNVKIITSYLTTAGVPYVTTNNVKLPMKLVLKPSAPNKEADHKVTISTNRPAISLPDLFPEYNLDGNAPTALGLQYYGGATITVLSSRTSNRYRLQSDSLPALWVILESIIERLINYWNANGKSSEDKMTIGITSPMPLTELYSEIDAHFLRRKKHKELEAQLVQRAVQFRAVQRRLLTKFKDKTPTPLTNLDNLLDGTYKQILQITEAINRNLKGLEEDGCQLSCVLRLLLKLLFIQSDIGVEQQHLLEAALSPIVPSNIDQGWEEVTDCSVTFVLRSLLGKGARDAGVASQSLAMLSDINKLKKHIGLLMDKTLKGGMVASEDLKVQNNGTKDSTEDYFPTDPDDAMVSDHPQSAATDTTEVPLGSKLGEDRARSARVRSARFLSERSKQFSSEDNVESPASDNDPDIESAIKNYDNDPNDDTPTNKSSRLKNSSSPIYEEIQEKDVHEEPIYAEIEDEDDVNIEESHNNESSIEDKMKQEEDDPKLKPSLRMKDNLIEAPEDIFGNPIEEDTW